MDDSFDQTGGARFDPVPAVRKQVPALVALWGLSDSGKTYSALRLARGLVGPKGKIVLVDTENGRALIYADKFGGWMHIDFQPPFTPERYQAALAAAIKAGANAVIFDSMSHVWQGEGGVLQQAENTKTEGLNKWRRPKMAYLRMANALFRAPVHVVFCLRAKNKNVQTGKGKDAQIVNVGYVPICDPDQLIVYETTVAVHMEGGTRKPLDPVKAPDAIAHAIKPGEFISEESGRLIADWLAGGAAVDKSLEALKVEARNIAIEGSVRTRDWWQSLTKAQRITLKPILPELQDLAAQADAEMAGDRSASPGADPLDDAFTPKREAAA